MQWSQVFLVWFLIIIAETLHGILRTLYITPLIGDHAARQIGMLIGSILIFLIAWFTIRWIGAYTRKDQLSIGTVWVILTILFEFLLGIMLNYPISRILSDYDITQGGFMGLGIIFMFFVPMLASTLKGKNQSSKKLNDVHNQ